MIATAVHHLSFRVEDLAASLHFYCDILGLKPIDRPEMGFPGAWLETDAGAQVHLIEFPRKEGEDEGVPARKLNPINNHSAFAIDDYQATLEHLRSHGLEVLETNPKMGQMWVNDPSGNVIEFITATATRD